MLKLLNLFVHRDFSLWGLEYNYGDVLATESGRIADHVSLQTDQIDQYLYAACSGELSVGLPVFTSVNLEQLPEDSTNEPLSETADLCLMGNPFVRSASQLLEGTLVPSVFDPNFQGFQYFNVDVQSLMEDLRELLGQSTVPPDANISDDEVERRMSRFLKGMLSVYVEGGQRLGKPGRKLDPLTPTLYQVGFTAVTSFGLWSPGDIYDRMRSFVEEEQDLSDFLVLVPKPPTAFSGVSSKAAAIQLTEHTLYNWSDLLSLKEDWPQSRADWRQVGNNQKALYRQRLLARSGLLPSGVQEVPAFEFNSQDWRNLFQLEAVVEYYANFDDPWVPKSVPLDISETNYSQLDRMSLVIQGDDASISNGKIILSGNPNLQRVRKEQHYIYLENSQIEHWFRIANIDNNGKVTAIDSKGAVPEFPNGVTSSPWRIDLYTSVDFLPLEGSGAIINGDEITLDGNPDFSRFKTKDTTKPQCLCDGIIFNTEPGRMYLIKSIIPGANKLKLEVVPTQLNGTTSAWQISHVPIIVLVDPLGPRNGLKGTKTTRIDTNIIKLEQPSPDLKKVNSHGFETIYLSADTARPSKTYRIVSANADNNTVTLDGDPSLPIGATSAWSIPAGIGGEPPPLTYNLGPGLQKLLLKRKAKPKANPPTPARPAQGPIVAKGFDHYDGVMYIVANGEATGVADSWDESISESLAPIGFHRSVHPSLQQCQATHQFRWTSYTSRTDQEMELPNGGLSDPEDNHRSIRGNHRYEVFSVVTESSGTGSDFRNYCFRVNDRLSDNLTVDNVFEARGYFEPSPTSGGQRRIRIHYGSQGSQEKPADGTGSAGCNVSPEFYAFRQALIDIYQRRYALLQLPEQPTDAEVAKLHKKKTSEESMALWNNSFPADNKNNGVKLGTQGWNSKIFCYYWLIRPGERPVPKPTP